MPTVLVYTCFRSDFKVYSLIKFFPPPLNPIYFRVNFFWEDLPPLPSSIGVPPVYEVHWRTGKRVQVTSWLLFYTPTPHSYRWYMPKDPPSPPPPPHPPPTWEAVAEAVDFVGEGNVAKEIREKYIPVSQPIWHPQVEAPPFQIP